MKLSIKQLYKGFVFQRRFRKYQRLLKQDRNKALSYFDSKIKYYNFYS